MSYPILLNLRGRRAVVVGGGKVAARKVSDLLTAGAVVIIISPALHPQIETLRDKIESRQTHYVSGMLVQMQQANETPFMVFAATNSPDINAQVAAEAHDLGILVNVVDDSANCDFSNMATIRRGDVTVAVATGGASPALTAHLRALLEGVIGEEYATLARWLGELRPTVKAAMSPERRAALWEALLTSEVLAHLRDGDEAGARAIIDALMTDATEESD